MFREWTVIFGLRVLTAEPSDYGDFVKFIGVKQEHQSNTRGLLVVSRLARTQSEHTQEPFRQSVRTVRESLFCPTKTAIVFITQSVRRTFSGRVWIRVSRFQGLSGELRTCGDYHEVAYKSLQRLQLFFINSPTLSQRTGARDQTLIRV